MKIFLASSGQWAHTACMLTESSFAIQGTNLVSQLRTYQPLNAGDPVTMDAEAKARWSEKPDDATIAAFTASLPPAKAGTYWHVSAHRPSNPHGWGAAMPYVLNASTYRIDKARVSDVKVEGINHSDAPDYVDAYIGSATYTPQYGEPRPMTEAELEWLNNDRDMVAEALERQLH